MKKPPSDRELAEKHKYKLESGEIAINVTAISGLMDLGKSSAFAGAAKKLADQGLNYREVWAGKAELGTRVHGYLESFLDGEPIDQQEGDDGYVDALEHFIEDHSPSVIEKEVIVLSSKGYGGRLDLIAEVDNGEVALIDLKSGRENPLEICLQLSAYKYADGIAVYDEEGTLTGLRPLPEIDWSGGLYVREDGSYMLKRYPVDETVFATFCHLLECYKWTRTDQMKALQKEARSR